MRGCRCPMIMGFTKPIGHSNPTMKEGDFMNPLYVRIDVSSKSNVVYFMLPDGSKHGNFSVDNSHDDSTQLVQRILSAKEFKSLDMVLIGLKSTSVYGDNLVYFLREDASLASFDRKIHVLNPKQVKKFKDAYNDLPKNDYVDSFVIANGLRFGRISKEVYIEGYHYKALQNLTRSRYFAICNIAKEKQRFINVLFKKYSSTTQEKVSSDIFSTTALAIYHEFESAEALAYKDVQELTAFIIDKGKNRFPDPNAEAKAIQKAIRSSYRLPKMVNDSVNQALSISITSMKALESQIEEFYKSISAQIALLPNVLNSIPDITPVYSAGIMAEIGDINRFDNQAQLAKYAGLAQTQYQSDNFEAENTRLIKSGNRFLKYYLCESAFSLERYDKEYKAFYHQKYKEVNRHQHKHALALTARKFVRLIFTLSPISFSRIEISIC